MVEVIQNTDWYFDVIIKSKNPDGTYTPINITGWTIKYGIATEKDGTAIFINNTTIHTDAVNGKTQIHIPYADQGGITPGIWYHEIMGLTGSGIRVPIVKSTEIEVINSLVF